MEELINSGFRAYAVVLAVAAIALSAFVGQMILKYRREITGSGPTRPAPAPDPERTTCPALSRALASIAITIDHR